MGARAAGNREGARGEGRVGSREQVRRSKQALWSVEVAWYVHCEKRIAPTLDTPPSTRRHVYRCPAHAAVRPWARRHS